MEFNKWKLFQDRLFAVSANKCKSVLSSDILLVRHHSFCVFETSKMDLESQSIIRSLFARDWNMESVSTLNKVRNKSRFDKNL
jgi:hypothetical protein